LNLVGFFGAAGSAKILINRATFHKHLEAFGVLSALLYNCILGEEVGRRKEKEKPAGN